MKSLIIGKGEIGKALYEVLRKVHPTHIRDLEDESYDNIEVLHICFPYTDDKAFIQSVKKYQKMYQPRYTIIHSTVPVGTSQRLDAFHSPVRGIHPHLEKSLKTFVKYLAPKDRKLKKYFEKAGIKIVFAKSSMETELAKLYDTTIYGLNIIIQKEIKRVIDWVNENKKTKLDFNLVYRDFNKTYNEGYEELGFPQYKKYILKPSKGSIGGHCIIPNCKLLRSNISNFIIKENVKYDRQ